MLAELRHLARASRLDSGVTQLDVATRAGVSHVAVSRFERGGGWPEDPEAMVAAFEVECGLEKGELWQAAVEQAFGKRETPPA